MKSFGIPDEIHAYALERSDGLQAASQLGLTSERRFGDAARMNIGNDQGRFMQMLVSAMRAQTVVEIGTFTGMSALWMATGLPEGGKLICFDISDQYADTAREAWAEAGVLDRIELRIGPAADGLAELAEEPHIDLAFVDADKTGYRAYLDLLMPRMTDHGVILVDNVLWAGQVLDPADQSSDTVALREFNDHVAERSDCDVVILTVGDGITMIRPRR